jgi:hypothetical protein
VLFQTQAGGIVLGAGAAILAKNADFFGHEEIIQGIQIFGLPHPSL